MVDNHILSSSHVSSLSVSSAYVNSVLSACEMSGLDITKLKMSSQLLHTDLSSEEKRIEIDVLILLWENIVYYANDPLIGCKIGRNFRLGHWGLVEMLALSSSSLEDIVQCAIKYSPVVADDKTKFDIIKEKKSVVISFLSSLPLHAESYEADMVYLDSMIKEIFGKKYLPIEYRFSHAMPEQCNIKHYQYFFDAPVVFSCSTNALVLPAEIYDEIIYTDNYGLKALLEERAICQLSKVHQTLTAVQEVESHIKMGVTDLKSVALSLGISSRTLQRRLRNEGASFNELLNQVKKRKAKILLEETELSIPDISDLLGYKEERAFYHAVDRWFSLPASEMILNRKFSEK